MIPTVELIIQARMTSSRLPGKVLKPVLGKPVLELQIERLRRMGDWPIVLATTTLSSDDPVVDLGLRLGLSVYRGSESDVLDRFFQAATAFPAANIVRLTADCPLIDPGVSRQIIEYYLAHPEFDYVSNALKRTYPIGLDTEIFRFDVLKEAWQEACDPEQREHVTPFINRQPERYHIGHVSQPVDLSQLRWTLDTAEDLAFVTAVYEALYPLHPEFDMNDILKLLDQQPELKLLNANVAQKSLKLDQAEFKGA